MDNFAVTAGLATSPAPLARWAADLEERTPRDILAWAAGRYAGRLAFATGFGPEGCVLIDMIGRERLPIDIFTLDTGLLFPETRDLWRRLEARYDLRIRSATPELSVEDQAVLHGERLWERQPEHCCGMRKVAPLRAELARVDAWISAIRREQTPQRAGARVVEPDAKFGSIKINPLVRWTKRQVWAHILEHGVPYNPLHDRGYPSIGCAPCTSIVEPGEDDRSGRWRGTARTECGLHVHGAAQPAEPAIA